MTGTRAADRHPSDQLARDRELYAQLERDGFEGPRFDLLGQELWLYGWRVTRSWMKDGSIIERCGANDIVVSTRYDEIEILRRRADLRDDLAVESVAPAVAHFMHKLLAKGHWDPDKGASMRTYFLRSCLHYFRTAYRTWSRRHRSELARFVDWSIPDSPSRDLSPEQRAALRDEVRQLLAGASWEVQAICTLIYETGGTQTEIAGQLQMTPRMVEGYMRRFRARVRRTQLLEGGNGR